MEHIYDSQYRDTLLNRRKTTIYYIGCILEGVSNQWTNRHVEFTLQHLHPRHEIVIKVFHHVHRHWPSRWSVPPWSGRPGFSPRSRHTKNLKNWYLIYPCLTLSIGRCVSKVKWSNPGEGVAPSLRLRCSSY